MSAPMPPEEVRRILTERASNPNTEPVTLQAIATFYPREVLANPALPLVQLEDPTRWQSIVTAATLSLDYLARRAAKRKARP